MTPALQANTIGKHSHLVTQSRAEGTAAEGRPGLRSCADAQRTSAMNGGVVLAMQSCTGTQVPQSCADAQCMDAMSHEMVLGESDHEIVRLEIDRGSKCKK